MKTLARLTLIFLALAGCSSTPVAIEHYVLNAPTGGQTAQPEQCRVTRPAVIERVVLPRFLRQSGLAMQSGENQIHISKTHLWAENLDEALPKVLQKNLLQLSGGCAYYIAGHDWVPQEHYRLRLRIDVFQATDAGEVISTGRIQVLDAAGDGAAVTGTFALRRELQRNGYGHAVAQLALLGRDIAERILQLIESVEASQAAL